MDQFKKSLPITLALLATISINKGTAQISNQTYSFQHDQKYSDVLYNPNTRLHTSSKPFLYKGDLLSRKDSLASANAVDSKNWFMRKIFNEHLVEVNKDDHSFFLDFLPDAQLGKELLDIDKRKVYLNTRGVQAGLNIKDKFTFYANFFENQAVFPKYLTDYIDANNVVPGQGNVEDLNDNKKDWMYATANMSYDVNDYLQVTLAYDKNHIGDGYRSLLLSDFSTNYAHLKFTGNIGNVQYTSVWAYMLDPKNPRLDSLDVSARYGDGIKWGAFQYLDWNATNRLSVGFFQAVVWANRNAGGNRGFDFNYLNPVIFLRPVESNNSSSPDKMFLGATAKYKLLNNMTAYGQFLLGEFTAKEFFSNSGYAHNKWGMQFGLRGFNAFKINKLNYLFEYNQVRPYTYQHFTSTSNYSNMGEALAHPRGANFRELLGMINYSWKRFDFTVQGLYSKYGTDPNANTNMGGDIFQTYINVPNIYGNKIGQGIKNDLYYGDLKAAYVLNPKYNLRFELGYTQRYQKIENDLTKKSGVINFGLRSSFRNFYGDM